MLTSAPRAALLALLLAFVPVVGWSAENWPQWRGPAGQGHSSATGLPTNWSETENIAWRTELPGKGWSSPVIDGNEIWLTAAIDTPASPEKSKQRLEKNSGNQPLNVAESLNMRAMCVDRASGKLLHNVDLMTQADPQWIHTQNSYASPSPVLEGGRLYCHFGANGTCCLDTKTQQVVWSQRELVVNHENGPGSTPVIHGDVLIIHFDGSDQQFVVGLNKHTGKVVWKTDRSGKLNSDPQLKKSYGTPLVLEFEGKPVVVSPAADWVYGYDPATGSELWKLNYGQLGFSIVPRPVAGHGLVYLSTSFMQSQLLAIKIGPGMPEVAWRYNKQVPQQPSPLLVGDELYMVSDKGVATCLNAKTGDMHWTERIGGNFSSSPLFADGKIFLMSREGDTTVLKPGVKFEKLAANKLDGQIMASPAALESALYVRTDKALYRIERPRSAGK